jgi:hypothetical protein
MIPSSPHNGILITIIGILVSAPFLIWALVLYERQRKIEKQTESIKLTENIKSEANLKVGAKVNHVSTYDYPAKAFGQTEFMNGKQIVVDVTLFPPKQMKIDSITLELFGKPYPAKESSIMIIKDSQSYKFSFDIPVEIAINTNEAVIKVLSANQIYPSNLFEINFTESAK